jgi:hypothetical protein
VSHMAQANPAFEKTYRDYLAQLAAVDLHAAAEMLGGYSDGGKAVVMPFFGRPYTVSAAGISDPSGSRPSHSVGVLLSKYLLMCPLAPPADASWVSYKDFRDAGPFVGGFRNNAELPLERAFGSNPAELKKHCEPLGGVPAAGDFPYEVAMQLPALPKIPILLLFNGADDEFPARCTMLFERRSEKYLDMECLAITGWALSAYLLDTPQWGSL